MMTRLSRFGACLLVALGSSYVLGEPGYHYELKLVSEDFPAAQIPKMLAADFDGDGISDDVARDGSKIVIRLSGGMLFEHDFKTQFHDLQVYPLSLSRDGRFPSLIVSTTVAMHTPGPQHIVWNDAGSLSVRPTGLTLAGRGVDCQWPDSWPRPVCLLTGYRGDTKLASFAADGTATDLTAGSGLPFPINHARGRHRGFFTIGAAFLDFDADGDRDLVTVAQHAPPLVASLGPDQSGKPYFESATLRDLPPEEYLGVYAPRLDWEPKFAGELPPCVYYATERGEASMADHIECYDQDGGFWYYHELPGRYWMAYEWVRFWDHDDDGHLDFAARREDGKWSLFSLVKVKNP